MDMPLRPPARPGINGRPRVPRPLVVAAATLLLQVLLAVLCSVSFSRLLQGSASGWGDLIGATVGVYVGSWAGLLVALSGFGRRAGRPWWVLLLAAASTPPVQVMVIAVLVNLGAPFPVVGATLLALSCALVLLLGRRREPKHPV